MLTSIRFLSIFLSLLVVASNEAQAAARPVQITSATKSLFVSKKIDGKRFACYRKGNSAKLGIIKKIGRKNLFSLLTLSAAKSLLRNSKSASLKRSLVEFSKACVVSQQATPTLSATPTSSAVPTVPPTTTGTPFSTATVTPTGTLAPTSTPTRTPTPAVTHTPTSTPSPTATGGAPIANSQSVLVLPNTLKDITLTGSDPQGSPLTFSIFSSPTHGSLSGSGANRTYTPDQNYVGADSFTFRVFDGGLFSQPATVTINVTTGSRLNGVAPLAVFFDATTFNHFSDTHPFQNLKYSWNFGDSNAGTWTTDGKSKNKATAALAAHVFESAGNYTVTLTIADGSGVEYNYQETISVQDPNNVFSGSDTICVSNTPNFTNCPANALQAHLTNLNQVQNFISSGKRILFRRGEAWSATNNGEDSGAIELDASGPGLVGTFGSGSKPIINQTGIGHVFKFTDSDWRIVDFKVNSANNSIYNSAIGISPSSSNALVLRVDVSGSFAGGLSNPWGSASNLHFAVDSSFNNIGTNAIEQSTGNSVASNNIGMTGSRLVLMGNTAIGSQNHNEHTVRIFYSNKIIISHNIMADPASEKHVLKLHNDHDFQKPFSQYLVVSDNLLSSDGWTVTIGPQGADANETVKDVLVERNIIYGGTPLLLWCQNTTARNNILLGWNSAGDFSGIFVGRRGIEPVPNGINLFNNTVYTPYNSNGTSYEFKGLEIRHGTNITLKNSLASAPNWEETASEKKLIDNSVSVTQSNNLMLNNAGFVNPASGNFSLQVGSPAVNTGTTVSVFDDITETPRPQGGIYDVGAHEYAQ